MRVTYAAIAAVVLVLAGCSDGTQEPVATTSTSSPTSAVTATPASLPAVVDYGAARLVTGTEIWSLDQGTVMGHGDGTSHSRDGTVHSTFKCADPRVAGTAVGTWNSDRWGTFDNGALVQWGQIRITNSGGAWAGRLAGIYTTETHDVITFWFTGTGKYAGLAMYLWETPTSAAPEFPFTALVFPGAPPPR
jgi:hypothetical protein